MQKEENSKNQKSMKDKTDRQKSNSQFLEKRINQILKVVAGMYKKKRERTQITNVRNDTEPIDFKGGNKTILQQNMQQLHKIDNFLKKIH